MNHLVNRLRLRLAPLRSDPERELPLSDRTLLSRIETLRLLVERGCGLSRFGDGELAIALLGRSIRFQAYDERLADRMLEVLGMDHPDVLVCLNSGFMCSPEVRWVLDYERSPNDYARFLSCRRERDVGVVDRERAARRYREYFRILARQSSRSTWGEATLFFLGLYFDEYVAGQIGEVMELMRRLFARRRALFVAPQMPLMGPSFRQLAADGALAGAASVDFLTVPANDCFAQYKSIRREILRRPGVDAVFIQAGPTATVLAHELMVNHGLLAYDVGSMNTALAAIHRVNSEATAGAAERAQGRSHD